MINYSSDLNKKFRKFENNLLSSGSPGCFSGKEIKAVRQKYNLSQKCFAQMLGINYRTLQNYECNHRAIPSTGVALFKFADNHTELFKKHYLTRIDNLREFIQ